MPTAIDTNVLAALFAGTSIHAPQARIALRQVQSQDELVISAPVYAEILAMPGSSMSTIDSFLENIRIAIDWRIDEAVWRVAAHAYRGYADRRRAQRGDP